MEKANEGTKGVVKTEKMTVSEWEVYQRTCRKVMDVRGGVLCRSQGREGSRGYCTYENCKEVGGLP